MRRGFERKRARRALPGLCAAAVAALGLPACSSGSSAQPEAAQAPASRANPEATAEGAAGGPISAAASAAPVFAGGTVAFDPANFVDPTTSTNPFQPLKPGTQWTYGGTTEVGSREVPHGIISTVTDVVRMIEGVPAVAVLDESTDSGETAQIGMDYMALDRDGNVWILGGYTEDYEGGQYTNVEGAWLGPGKGQAVGILAPRNVDMTTTQWFIAQAPKEDASVGSPVEVGARTCVQFGCYDNVRVVEEGEDGAPDNEHKYYAPGVGVIKNVPLDASLHQDRFELLNFVELTATGLAEASRTVLDLEAHARQVAAKVYGPAPESRRVR